MCNDDVSDQPVASGYLHSREDSRLTGEVLDEGSVDPAQLPLLNDPLDGVDAPADGLGW